MLLDVSCTDKSVVQIRNCDLGVWNNGASWIRDSPYNRGCSLAVCYGAQHNKPETNNMGIPSMKCCVFQHVLISPVLLKNRCFIFFYNNIHTTTLDRGGALFRALSQMYSLTAEESKRRESCEGGSRCNHGECTVSHGKIRRMIRSIRDRGSLRLSSGSIRPSEVNGRPRET